MVLPDPELAPVMPPVTAPITHEKVLGVVAVKLIPGLVVLQIVAVEGVVTVGTGLTVTVMVNGVPTHEPVEAIGVTI